MTADRQGGEAAEVPMRCQRCTCDNPATCPRVRSSGSAAQGRPHQQPHTWLPSDSAAQNRKRYIVDWTENGDPILLDPSIGPPHPVIGTHDLPAPSGSAAQNHEAPWVCDACEDTGVDRREGIPCGCGARSSQDEDQEPGLRSDRDSWKALAADLVRERDEARAILAARSPERDTRAETVAEDEWQPDARTVRAMIELHRRYSDRTFADRQTARMTFGEFVERVRWPEFGPARAQEPQEKKP